MKTVQLLENLTFHEGKSNVEPLHRDKNSRILRFMLNPGQTVSEHNQPNSPVHIVVVKGQGLFSGGDGEAQQFGPNTLLFFDPGENHAIQALDEALVFLVILHGSSSRQ